MQTMTMKQGMPTANPMTNASSFSVKQNGDENTLMESSENGQTQKQTK